MGKTAAEHLKTAELCAGDSGYSAAVRRAVSIAAIEAAVAEERDSWKAWHEETLAGIAEGQDIVREEGRQEERAFWLEWLEKEKIDTCMHGLPFEMCCSRPAEAP